MNSETTTKQWRTSAAIRIIHRNMEPETITAILHTPATITKRPGESRIPHGNSKSAGYWCIQHWVDEPTLPDRAFLWAEQFFVDHTNELISLIDLGCNIDVYIGIKSKLIALGFNVPALPTIWKLGIPVGLEYFSS